MKTDDQIYDKLGEYENPRALGGFQRLVVQALQWARLRINHDPDEAEVLIRARIASLEEMQDKKEIMGFATKPARAFQINALKWVDIREGIESLQTDIERMCGFCHLAKEKAKDTMFFRCTFCEPDAKKLCDEYITDEKFIVSPLYEAWENTDNLLNKIRSLPVDLK